MLYKTENTHGGDIYKDRIDIDFSVNINPLGTPARVREAIRAAADRAADYPDPFCRELVTAISKAEEVPEEWILCGNGAAELIYGYCQALGWGRLKMAETAPSFSEYSLAAELAGGEVFRYPLKENIGFRLDHEFPDFLEKVLAQESSGRKMAVFLCNPNNPDGRNIPVPLLEEVLCWCAGHGAGLFLDECFLQMSDHPQSMKPFLQDHPELFLLKAFTKDYGMAGVRLGYGLCSDPDLLKSISRLTQPWNVSIPAQAAGIAALQEKDWILRAREIIPEERKWLSGQLRDLKLKVYPSEANYLLVRGEPGLDRKLRKEGIAIRSCANYHNLGEGWYRIGLRLHEENVKLTEALRRVQGIHDKE